MSYRIVPPGYNVEHVYHRNAIYIVREYSTFIFPFSILTMIYDSRLSAVQFIIADI